ncbi:MAG: hypothetical protein ACK4Z4_17915 [Ferrovibrio sp.]
MHQLSTALLLGYHGCDASVAKKLIGGSPFKPSENIFDWLGSGVYFWEANPKRALEFAEEQAKRGKVSEPDVVGAVISLGLCLDLTTKAGLDAVAQSYADLKQITEAAGENLPTNSGDMLRRNLDCAVVNYLTRTTEDDGLTAIDSVRGVFIEGREAYPNSGFMHKTHIQIAIRNLDCIKGVFRVRPQDLD